MRSVAAARQLIPPLVGFKFSQIATDSTARLSNLMKSLLLLHQASRRRDLFEDAGV